MQGKVGLGKFNHAGGFDQIDTDTVRLHYSTYLLLLLSCKVPYVHTYILGVPHTLIPKKTGEKIS